MPKKRLERPDFDGLYEQTDNQVTRELGAIADPVARASRAAEIIAAADHDLAAAMNLRNRAMVSLWAWDQVMGLYFTAGLHRQTMQEHLQSLLNVPKSASLPSADDDRIASATKAGFTQLPDDAETLPVHAQEVVVARARRDTAKRFRNDVIRVLAETPYSWTNAKIGELVGMGPSSVSDVLTGRRGRS